MIRTSLAALTFTSLTLVALSTALACGPAPQGEGEGEGAAGEGEGAAGEGEGAAGEGEGEGSAGEGEGEGASNDVGDTSSPLDVGALAVGTDITEAVTLDPAGDVDCYQFTVASTLVLTATTSGSCATLSGVPDTQLSLYASSDVTTPLAFNDDIGEDTGAATTRCSQVESVVDAGTYLVCVNAFAQDVGSGVTLTLDVQQQTVLADGAPCTADDVVHVCATGSQCLFDGTADVCGVPVTLAANATCVVGDELHTCDATANLGCFSTAANTFQCVVQQVLADGATCDPAVNASICDPDQRLSCLNTDGAGTFLCKNAQVERCNNVTDIVGTSFTGPPGATDFADAQCNFTAGGRDLVLRYTTTGTRSRVSVTGAAIAGLELRSTCADPSTEIDCTDAAATSAVVPDVDQGTAIFILVDADASNNVTVNVAEDPITTLADGATCDPASTTSLCGRSSVCIDQSGGNAPVCTALQNGGETCDTAPTLAASGTLLGATQHLVNDYDFGTIGDSCTGFNTSGPDGVFAFSVPHGQTLTATATPVSTDPTQSSSFDVALYVTTTCPFTAIGQCLKGADAGFAGDPETLTFTNSDADTTVFLVVDSFSAFFSGVYTLTWTVQ